MKSFNLKLALYSCAALSAISTHAAVKYWDLDGPTEGAGSATPTGTWDTTTANWNTVADGTGAATTNAANDIAVFSAGTNGTGSFTLTGTGVAFNSITNEEGICTLAGTAFPLGAGTWTVKTGAQLRYAGTSAFPFNAAAGSAIVLDGGRIRNSTTGNAGNFLGTATMVNTAIFVTTNGGIFDVSASGTTVLSLLQGALNSISGPGGITKVGASVLAIATACTYSGPTVITAGELRIRTSANRLPITTDVTVTSPGILNLNSVAGSGAVGQQIGSLSGNGTVGLGNSVLVIDGTNSTTFSGSISNTANAGAGGSTSTAGNGVIKQGTNTITLSGPNGFTGFLTLSAGGINVTTTGALCDPTCDLIVNGGTLSLTNSAQGVENLGGTGGTIILNTGHTLTINPINASRSSTYSGIIVGDGGITKIGAPTEFLLGTNTYSGPTTISVGKLYIGAANATAGTYSVAAAAALGTTQTAAGGAANVANLSLDDGGVVEFDLASLGFPAAKLINSGTITVNGNSPVNVKGFNNLSGGPVTLLEYTGVRSGAGSFVLGTLPPHTGAELTDDTANSRVTLNVTNADSLIWVSDPAGVWNVNSAGNTIWKLASDSSATYYQETAVQGDTVRFDDTKTDTATVSIPGTVTPYRVTVDNSATNYTFTGAGKISGVGAVTKSGPGQLTIATTNDYTGGTTLNAGTVNVGNNSPFGTGKLTINGGAIRSDSATARTVSVPVDLNGNVTFGDAVNTGDLTFQTGTWTITGASREINVDTINAAINTVIAQDVAGRGLAKNGNGTLSLAAVNTFSGGLTLNQGTLRVNGSSAILANSPVILADGVTVSTTAGTARTITGSFTVNGNITMGQAVGGTAAITLAGSMNLGGVTRTFTLANAADTISAAITNGGVTLASAGTLTLSGANNYNGLTTINAGTISVTGTNSGSGGTIVNTGGILSLNANGKLASGTLTLAGGNVTETANRESNPIPNPVVMTGDTDFFATLTGSGYRWIVFSSDSITTTSGTLRVRNLETAAPGTNALRFSGGGFTMSRPVVIGVAGDNAATNSTAALALYGTNGAGDTTISGQISGYGLLVRGASTVGTGGRTILTGDNGYTGGTSLNDGEIAAGISSTGPADAPTSGPIGTGVLTIGSSAGGISASGGARVVANHVVFNSSPLGIVGSNDLELSGNVDLNAAVRTVQVDNSAVSLLSGTLSNGGLTKSGNGTLTLSGANSYTFDTTVNAGTLLVNGSLASTNIIVNSGGTLGGNGGVTGTVTVNGGGGISAGSSPGTITLLNGLNLSAGGTNVWELAANTTNSPGSSFDQINLTGGNLVLGGSSRVLVKFTGTATFPNTNNAFWQHTNTWQIIAGFGTAANPGSTTFAGVDGASGNNAGGFTTSADASGNVYLTFTPGAQGVQAPPPVISPNVVGAGTTSAQVSWSSVAGATYKVQYKTNLNQVGWLDLTNLTASGTSTTIVDSTSPVPKERYYRVISP